MSPLLVPLFFFHVSASGATIPPVQGFGNSDILAQEPLSAILAYVDVDMATLFYQYCVCLFEYSVTSQHSGLWHSRRTIFFFGK